MPLSHQQAHKRTLKAWETKRKKNPYLSNIEKVGDKVHEWHRPNGEVVPLHGFTDKHVESMAQAFHQSDKHLKEKINLNLFMQERDTPREGLLKRRQTAGGAIRSADIDAGRLVTAMYAKRTGLPKNEIGRRNAIVLNPQVFEHQRVMNPSGVAAHEIGHIVGPGHWDVNLYKDTIPVGRRKQFSKSFQWKDRGSALGPDNPINWKKKHSHPNKTKRQGVNYNEDFAESYRSLIGVPVDARKERLDTKSGLENTTSPWYWSDRGASREKYMKKYHLESTERRRHG